jgi:hypothetical protein
MKSFSLPQTVQQDLWNYIKRENPEKTKFPKNSHDLGHISKGLRIPGQVSRGTRITGQISKFLDRFIYSQCVARLMNLASPLEPRGVP